MRVAVRRLERLVDVVADHEGDLGDSLAQPAYAAGRVDTARRWLAWFEDQELIDDDPSVAVLGACCRHWSVNRREPNAGQMLPNAGAPRQTPPDGSTLESNLAMLRGLLCRNGLGRMRADAYRDLGRHCDRPGRTLRGGDGTPAVA